MGRRRLPDAENAHFIWKYLRFFRLSRVCWNMSEEFLPRDVMAHQLTLLILFNLPSLFKINQIKLMSAYRDNEFYVSCK